MKTNKILLSLVGISALSTSCLSMVGCGNNDGTSLITLRNNKDMEVTFCDTGASIYSIYYKGTCVTYHPEDKNEFANSNLNEGKTIGRTAGRIANGEMNIGGTKYYFDKNEGNNTLHGGKKSLASKKFTYETKKESDRQEIIFNYFSPSGENGYPGDVDFKITYTLFNNVNSLRLDMDAYIGNNAPIQGTPINLTGHTYWRLGGSNEDGIRKHQLKVPADYVAKANAEDQVLEEEQIPVDSGGDFQDYFDFRDFKEVGKDLDKIADVDKKANGYDHGWLLNDGQNTIELQNESSNIHLSVETDGNMVFIFTNNAPNENVKMNHYGYDAKYGGIAIEPQTYFYRNHYDDILRKDHYHHYIQYTLDDNVSE